MLSGPTPLWVSTYTSYFSHKVQGPFSPGRQSHSLKTYFLSFFGGPVFLNGPRNSGREHAWWTNSPVDQYLRQLSLVQSSRSIQPRQTVPWPKHLFLSFLGGTSLCLTDQETLWASTYTSYLSYKVQGPFSPGRQSYGLNTSF